MAENEPQKKLEDPWWRPALAMFFELSGWIAGPIIIAVFLGSWLDEKYGTAPWLFLITVGAAMVISMVGLVKGATKAIKQMENLSNKKEDTKNNKPDDK